MKRIFPPHKKHKLIMFLLLLFSLSFLILSQSVLGATFNLNASWTANTDPNVRDYRLYRTDGTRTLLGTTPHPNTTLPFTVTVSDGSYGTLIFVLTAVDINNLESADSSPASYNYDLRPTVTITATDNTATENPLTTGYFTVTRTGSTSGALTVYYTGSGTATSGSDYNSLSGNVTIPAGSSTGTITVTPINDSAVESDETVIVTLSTNASYTRGSPYSATVTITSDDVTLPTVTIAATDNTATENPLTTGYFTVTRTGSTSGALTVYYTGSGTATSGSDYNALSGNVTIPAGSSTGTITVTPINDSAVESDETVIVTLSTNAAYTRGSPYSATVTITSDDVATPTVTITATDNTATEAGPTTGTFTVSRTGSTTGALTVYYTGSGTATSGSDYNTLSGSVAIPAGSSTGTITVTPINDTAVESDETVIVTLSTNASYTRGSPYSATVTITSDDVSNTTYTVTTNPTGLPILVDGNSYTGPHTFTWAVGSSHTLSVPSPQNGGSGTQYVFASWSDRKAQTHSIIAPSSSTTFTANLTTQYMLTTSINLPEGGSVNLAGTLWYKSGQKISLRAKANKNYVFTGWSGNAFGTVGRFSLIMDGPKNITANFKLKPFIQVLAPNGGEGYLVGETTTISWDSGSLDPNGTLYLFYYYDRAWHPITTLPTTATSFVWTIPRIPELLGSEIPKARARSTRVWIGNWVNGGWECCDWSDQDSFILHDAWVFTISGGDSGGATLIFDENIFSGYGISLELGMFRIDGNYIVNTKGQISGDYRLFDFYNLTNELGSGELSGSISSRGTSILQLKNVDGKLFFKMDGFRSFEDPVIPTNWMAIVEGYYQGTFNSLTIEPYQYGSNDYSPIFRVVGTGSTLEGSVNIEGYFFMTMKTTGSGVNSGNLLYGFFEMTGAIEETGGFSGTLNPITRKFTFALTSDSGNKFKLVGNGN